MEWTRGDHRRPGWLSRRLGTGLVPMLGALLALWGASTAAQPASPTVAGCAVFPADNVWNARVLGLVNQDT